MMKQKLKDFWCKNGETVKVLMIIVGSIATGYLGLKSANLIGWKKGYDTGLNLIGVLTAKALEKKPDITLEEFCDEEFIKNLCKEIMESK